jgi:hypothetical protein
MALDIVMLSGANKAILLNVVAPTVINFNREFKK